MVGTSVLANATTNENVACTFSVNGSAALNQSTTTNLTEHIVNVSGFSYNTTYLLNVSCTDDASNTNATTKSFSAWNNGLIFMTATANQTMLIAGKSVNITLDILSRYNVTGLNLSMIKPDATEQEFNISHFSPALNSSNRYGIRNGFGTVIDTSQAGSYNLRMNNITNGADTATPTMPVTVSGIFETFSQINQTLSIN